MSRADRKERAKAKVQKIKKDLQSQYFTYTNIENKSMVEALRMLDKWANRQLKKNPQERALWLQGVKEFAKTLRGE